MACVSDTGVEACVRETGVEAETAAGEDIATGVVDGVVGEVEGLTGGGDTANEGVAAPGAVDCTVSRPGLELVAAAEITLLTRRCNEVT